MYMNLDPHLSNWGDYESSQTNNTTVQFYDTIDMNTMDQTVSDKAAAK